jgi:hypothetical protein
MDIYKTGQILEQLAGHPEYKQACEAREKELGIDIDEIVKDLPKYVEPFPVEQKYAAAIEACAFYMYKHADELKAEFQPIFDNWCEGFVKQSAAMGLSDEDMIKLAQHQWSGDMSGYETQNLKGPGEAMGDWVGNKLGGGFGGGAAGMGAQMAAYSVPVLGTALSLGDAGANIYNAFGKNQTIGQRAGHLGMGALNVGIAGLGLVGLGGLGRLGVGAAKGIGKGLGFGAKAIPGISNAAKGTGGTIAQNTTNFLTANTGWQRALNNSKPGKLVGQNPMANLVQGKTGWQQNARTWGKELAPPLPQGMQGPLPMMNSPGFGNQAKRGIGAVASNPMVPMMGGYAAGGIMTQDNEQQMTDNMMQSLPSHVRNQNYNSGLFQQ